MWQNLEKCSIWVLGVREVMALLPLFVCMFEIFIIKHPYWLGNFTKRFSLPGAKRVSDCDCVSAYAMAAFPEASVTS